MCVADERSFAHLLPMGLAQLVGFARFHTLSRQPALCQLEEDDGLRLVDLEKDGRMNVDADEHNASILRGPVADHVLAKPPFPIGFVQFPDLAAVARQARDTGGGDHSYEPAL